MSFLKLAALGALGACGGLLALYALLVVIMLPNSRTASDMGNAAVALISVGGVIAALILVHLLAARVLFRMAREEDRIRAAKGRKPRA